MDQTEIQKPEPRMATIRGGVPGIPDEFAGAKVEVEKELSEGRFSVKIAEGPSAGKLFDIDGNHLAFEAVSKPEASRNNLKAFLRRAVLSRIAEGLMDGNEKAGS